MSNSFFPGVSPLIPPQEELNGLIATYERRGYFDEILSLLEAGLSLERAHVRQTESSDRT